MKMLLNVTECSLKIRFLNVLKTSLFGGSYVDNKGTFHLKKKIKHDVNVTFECSLNILKQVVTFNKIY